MSDRRLARILHLLLGVYLILPLAGQVTPVVNTIQTPGQPPPNAPAAQAPAAQPPAAQPQNATAPQTTAAAVEAGAPLMGSLTLQNANLGEVVDQLARTLKLN